MTTIIDSRPVLDFFLDVFESEELSINLIIVNMGHTTGRPSIRHMPTKPPAQKGVVVPVRITPVPLEQPKKGKRG